MAYYDPCIATKRTLDVRARSAPKHRSQMREPARPRTWPYACTANERVGPFAAPKNVFGQYVQPEDQITHIAIYARRVIAEALI
jgi:hypothetical protein